MTPTVVDKPLRELIAEHDKALREGMVLAGFYLALAEQQETLGKEFADAIYAGIEDLYES